MKSQKKRTPAKKQKRPSKVSNDHITSGDCEDTLIIGGNDTVVDLSNYGAAQPTYSISGYGTDTITLDPSMLTSSITIPSSTIYGATGSSTTSYTYSTASSWNQANVNISSNGIDMASGTDIKIDGKSLKSFMDKMEERLAILVPDPNKLEKFEALKKAYEHYKLMEKLCQEEPKEGE